MSDASHEDDALPSYGQNGRDLILKAARELESRASKKARERSPVAQPQPDFDDDTYSAAVPAGDRPVISYDPRAKIPRVVRQTALNRFVAQRLRLASRAVPHSQKLAFVAQEHVCSAAIKDATAQEAALYKRAANKQVLYANLLARTKAEEVASSAEQSPQPASGANQSQSKPHAGPKEVSGNTVAGAEDVGCSPSRPETSPQHAVPASEEGVPAPADPGTQQSATFSAAHAGSKRKHAEEQLMCGDGSVQLTGSD